MRLPVEPFEPDPDDEEAGPDVETADEVERLDEPAPPPRRRKTDKPGHRVKEPIGDAGPSPWERPRDGFTSSMAARSVDASNTREGRRVYGRVNW